LDFFSFGFKMVLPYQKGVARYAIPREALGILGIVLVLAGRSGPARVARSS